MVCNRAFNDVISELKRPILDKPLKSKWWNKQRKENESSGNISNCSLLRKIGAIRHMPIEFGQLRMAREMQRIRRQIDHLKVNAVAISKNEDPVTEIGIYRNSAGDVFKVNCSKIPESFMPLFFGKCQMEFRMGLRITPPKGAIYKLHSADKRQPTKRLKHSGLNIQCGICGRKLHNAIITRKLLIGPVCGEREFGDEFKAMHRNAKAELAAEQNTILESDSDSELELMF